MLKPLPQWICDSSAKSLPHRRKASLSGWKQTAMQDFHIVHHGPGLIAMER